MNKFLYFCRPTIGRKEEKAVLDVLRSGWLGKGPKTEEFEREFRKYTGSRYAVGVNSCTAALHLSLLASGIRKGDEVITTPLTFVSTLNAIIHTGASPVFVDVDKETFNIDPFKIEEKINHKTKVILPVHFAGLPCDMDRIIEIANRRNICVIEDAAHALGSCYKGRMIGRIGDFTCFSFYATKNISTGEGGMVTTSDKKAFEKVRILSNYGIDLSSWDRSRGALHKHWRGVHPGYNYKMYDIQAAIGMPQLKKINKLINIRQEYGGIYRDRLNNVEEINIQRIKDNEGKGHSYNFFPVVIKADYLDIGRDEIIGILRKKYKIETGVHYRVLPQNISYINKKTNFKKKDFPEARYISENIVSLPVYPRMRKKDVYYVAGSLKSIINRHRKSKLF